MSVQLLKPTGLRLMTSPTDIPLNKKGKIPWYVYFVGGVIYTVLAVMLFAESTLPVLAWICAISAPLGFYYAWGAWKQDTRNRDDANHAPYSEPGHRTVVAIHAPRGPGRWRAMRRNKTAK